MSATCVKCGSSRVIPRAKVYDQGEYSDGTLKAAFEQNPSAWFFKGRVLSNLYAVICGDCGFTELYEQNPGTLYEAFQPAADGARQARDAGSECLECGAAMADNQEVCPSCGWTFRGAEEE
jgi:uncharacterized OB-fold protein